MPECCWRQYEGWCYLDSFLYPQSDYPAARAFLGENLTIGRKLGKVGHLEVATVLELLAEVASETDDYSTGAKLYEEALPLYRKVGDLQGISNTLKMMCYTEMRAGSFGQIES